MVRLPVIRFHKVLVGPQVGRVSGLLRGLLGFPIVDQKDRFVEFQVTPESRLGLRGIDGKAACW